MLYATSHGLSGPASAMVQIQGIVQAFWLGMIQGIYPVPLQIIGMIFALVGAATMSLNFKSLFTSPKCKPKQKAVPVVDKPTIDKNIQLKNVYISIILTRVVILTFISFILASQFTDEKEMKMYIYYLWIFGLALSISQGLFMVG